MKPPAVYKNFYDVVILPPPAVRDYAIKLSKQIYKYGHVWYLGKHNFIPHISLYHIPVKPKHFPAFISTLKNVISGYPAGSLQMNRLLMLAISDGIFWMSDKPDWLKKLYLEIIKSTLPYYDWSYGAAKFWGNHAKTKEGKRNFKLYGTPNARLYFRPHITLGRCHDREKRLNVFRELKNKKFRFAADTVYVCEVGTYLSCQRIVKKIKF